MEIEIIKKNQQARGEFNGGEILENKPIGFPREGGHLKPYSNLFYWAHAWSDNGSTIGLHPHQGFEIMSFVLKKDIEHFDTKLDKWITLNEGAAQIIRAGNGISHSERINAGSHIFQIWFDPNLRVTLEKEASYDDYTIDQFPVEEINGIKTVTYKGEGSPLQMDTPGIEIYIKEFQAGEHELNLSIDSINSLYIIQGVIKVNEETLVQDDFFIVKDSNSIKVEAKETTRIFLISSPVKLDYSTYAEIQQNRWKT